MIPNCKIVIDIFHAEFQSNDFIAFLNDETYNFAKYIVEHGGVVNINIHFIDAPYESYLLKSAKGVDEFFHK